MGGVLAVLLPLLIVLACPAVLLLGGRNTTGSPRSGSREEIGPPRERIADPDRESPWWQYAEDFELWERES